MLIGACDPMLCPITSSSSSSSSSSSFPSFPFRYLDPPAVPASTAGSAGAGNNRLTAWSKKLEAQLKGVPSAFRDMIDELKAHLADGGEAELILG